MLNSVKALPTTVCPPMRSQTLHLDNLDTAVDHVHTFFEEWGERHLEEDGSFIDEDVLYEARLAAHEWTANLVQHADFNGRRPRIEVRLSHDGEQLKCTIEDNSGGFDMEGCLRKALDTDGFEGMPERGMGLLMLRACAADLSYGRIGSKRHQLQFSIAPEEVPTAGVLLNKEAA